MLVDNITIILKAGDGGNGAATFLRNAMTAKGGPDGGNGGNGGDVYFQGSANINDLRLFRFKKKVLAQDGTPGKHRKLFGKNAPHLTITLPLGTQITDLDTGQKFEITDTTPILIARGGKGGRGNTEFKSALNQTPRFAEPGAPGETKRLHLELKLIALVGITGLPNAGKSSLLDALTNAHPLIGDYPFTTLEPNIGMLGSIPIADIPGLIEGASIGKGLGTKFLRHIEKTKILIHCIDVSGADPQKAYETVRTEFKEHNPKLLAKREIVLLTKTDLVDGDTLQKTVSLFKKKNKQVLTSSVYDPQSMDKLKQLVEKLFA